MEEKENDEKSKLKEMGKEVSRRRRRRRRRNTKEKQKSTDVLPLRGCLR